MKALETICADPCLVIANIVTIYRNLSYFESSFTKLDWNFSTARTKHVVQSVELLKGPIIPLYWIRYA